MPAWAAIPGGDATPVDLPDAAVARALRSLNHDAIPQALIGQLVERHCRYAEDDGDVLVFLPGVREIEDLLRHLDRSGLGHSLWILPLHANVSARDQRAAFAPPPPGKTKVVLATAIAEASVTLATITLVIDAGLARCVLLDPAMDLPHLTTVPASQSSLQQLVGRAGRVRVGTCYHLLLSPLLAEREAAPARGNS